MWSLLLFLPQDGTAHACILICSNNTRNNLMLVDLVLDSAPNAVIIRPNANSSVHQQSWNLFSSPFVKAKATDDGMNSSHADGRDLRRFSNFNVPMCD